MSVQGPEELIAQASAELVKPAGDSPKFSSLEAIQKNHHEFVAECHKTWKKWHDRAIKEILVFEGFSKREKTHPIGHGAEEWAGYNRRVWRRVNDAIIWILVGRKRHIVKRLCFYRKRAYLSESNPTAVFETLDRLNANPMSIAIWNDATSCVDIGDITYISDGMTPHPEFWELKEGKVSAEVLTLFATFKSNPEALEKELDVFGQKYGKSGFSQIARFARQSIKTSQALALLNDEHGTDPVTGKELAVTEVTTPPEVYDASLNAALNDTLAHRTSALHVVDGCLWVYANADKAVNRHQVRRDFQQLLVKRIPHVQRSLTTKRPAWDADRIVCLNDGFGPPMAMPYFLRQLEADIIASVTCGDLFLRAFLYLDWDAFASLVKEEGGEFGWSSDKDARRTRAMKPELRSVVARGQVPQIKLGDAVLPVTDPMLVQMFFDGVTPRTVIRSTIELARAHFENARTGTPGAEAE